jgi:ankyrin repeat protein
VEALLAAGAEVDAQRHDGSTPLDLALNEGHAAVVSALLAAQSG